jgi:hypothetical protein
LRRMAALDSMELLDGMVTGGSKDLEVVLLCVCCNDVVLIHDESWIR